MAAKKCPVCGVSVKAENLERHVRNQHPRDQVDLSQTLTEEEREEIKEKRSATRPGLTRGGKRTLAIVAVVVAVLLVALVGYEVFFTKGIVGQPAPLFTLSTTDGTTVMLASYKGSPVLVEFMDVDCGFCQQEAPTLSGLYKNYSLSGVKFVSVDINFDGPTDTPTRIDSFRATYDTPWPYALDPGQTVQKAYGVTSTPTIFIIDKSGVVYKEMLGIAEASQSNLVTYLNAVLGG